MTDEALALAFRSGLPFVGLRDHTPDPDLDLIVPRDAARSARALPLAAEDDHIRLAVADPDPDLSALNPYLAGREIDLALAPREELDAILGPPPPVAEPEQAEAPEHTAPPDSDEPEPEAVAAEHTAPPETAEPEPDPLAAEPTAPPETAEPEPDPLAAEPTAPPETADPLAADGEPAAARDDDAEPGGGLEPDGEAAVVAAEPTVPVDDHPELAGEVPSWLEPARRRGRVVLTVLIVIVVLAVAAAVLIAVANA